MRTIDKTAFTRVMGELSVLDMDEMLAEARAHAPGLVADAVERIRPSGDDAELPAAALANVLGVVLGAVPRVWVGALRVARPDLVELVEPVDDRHEVFLANITDDEPVGGAR